jgi:hypothetical protein
MTYSLIDAPEFKEKNRINWLFESFKFALSREKMDVAIKLWDIYKDTFERDSDTMIKAIIDCMGKSCYYLELKLYILDKFLDHFQYKDIDKLITILENFSSEIAPEESYLSRNLNPIKTALLLINFLERIFESYAITELRVKHVSDFLMKSLKSILKNLYYPTEIKFQVR